MTRNDVARMVRLTVERLRRVEETSLASLFGEHPGVLDRDRRMIFWASVEIVRLEMGVDFGPVPRQPGHYERKTWVQIAERSGRQRRKGLRAQKRALERMVLASSLAPTEEQPRLAKSADWQATKLAMASGRSKLPGME